MYVVVVVVVVVVAVVVVFIVVVYHEFRYQLEKRFSIFKVASETLQGELLGFCTGRLVARSWTGQRSNSSFSVCQPLVGGSSYTSCRKSAPFP